MAKVVLYKIQSEHTEYEVVLVPTLDDQGKVIIDDETNQPIYHEEVQEKKKTYFYDASVECPTQESLDANLPMVQSEAYNGEYTIEGEFDPVDENPTTEQILDVLLGVNE